MAICSQCARNFSRFCIAYMDHVPEQVMDKNIQCGDFVPNPIEIQVLKNWLRRDDLSKDERRICLEMMDLIEGVVPITQENRERIEKEFSEMRQL